jgi:hypothetical protein
MIAGNSTRTSMTHENDSINHKMRTAAVEVEQQLLLPKWVNFATIDAPKLNMKAFNQADSGKDRFVLTTRKANCEQQIILSMQY